MEKVRPDELEVAKSLAQKGNVDVTNMTLGGLPDVPMFERLEILAIAYDMQSKIADNEARKRADSGIDSAYLVSPSELESKASRAVAQDLRDRAEKIRTEERHNTSWFGADNVRGRAR